MKSAPHADSRPQSKEAERQNRRLHLMLHAKPKSKGAIEAESKGFAAQIEAFIFSPFILFFLYILLLFNMVVIV